MFFQVIKSVTNKLYFKAPVYDTSSSTGYTLRHRLLRHLTKLRILTNEEVYLYVSCIEIANWRRNSGGDYSIFKGTKQEIREEILPSTHQVTFSKRFNKLLDLELIKKCGPRKWKVSNFFIHLAPNEWFDEMKPYKNSIPNFEKYLKKKIEILNEKNKKSLISEIKQNLLLFLTDEKYFKSFASSNKEDKRNEIPMKKEGKKKKFQQNYD